MVLRIISVFAALSMQISAYGGNFCAPDPPATEAMRSLSERLFAVLGTQNTETPPGFTIPRTSLLDHPTVEPDSLGRTYYAALHAVDHRSVDYAVALEKCISYHLELHKPVGIDSLAGKLAELHKPAYDTKYAGALFYHALALYQLGRYKEAESKINDCLTVREKIDADMDAGYSKAVLLLAEVCLARDHYDQADTYASIIFDMYKNREPLWTEYDRSWFPCLTVLSAIYCGWGFYQGGWDMLESGLLVARQVLEPGDQDYIGMILQAGICKLNLGDPKAAYEYLVSARDLSGEYLGQHHPHHIRALRHIAMLCERRGDMASAEYNYLLAMQLIKSAYGESHPLLEDIYLDLAELYIAMNNYTVAEHYTVASFISSKLSGNHDRGFSPRLMMTYAGQLYREGNYDLSVAFIKEALDRTNEYAETHYPLLYRMLARYLTYFMHFYGERDEFVRTLINYIRQRERLDPAYIALVERFASRLISQNNPFEAAEMLLECIEDLRGAGWDGNRIYLSLVYDIILALDVMGMNEEAAFVSREYLQSVGRSVLNDFSFLSDEDKELHWNALASDIRFLQGLALGRGSAQAGSDILAYDCELLLKGLVLNSTGMVRSRIFDGREEGLRELWELFTTVKEDIMDFRYEVRSVELDFRGDPSYEGVAEYGYWMADSTLVLLRIAEKDILAASYEIERQRLLLARTADSVGLSLGEREGAVEIVCCPDRDGEVQVYALVLTAAEGVRSVYIGPEKEIIIPGVGSVMDIELLFTKLWLPLLPLLENIETLYVSANGTVSLLPVEASARFMAIGQPIAMPEIHWLLSTKDIIGRNIEEPQLSTAALFGGIDYWLQPGNEDDEVTFAAEPLDGGVTRGIAEGLCALRGQGYDFLPGSLTEVTRSAAMLSEAGIGVTLFTGTDATRNAILDLAGPGSPGIIHISTHGFWFPSGNDAGTVGDWDSLSMFSVRHRLSTDPLRRSGLLLSGANDYIVSKGHGIDTALSGILSAYEISNRFFPDTSLAVLPCCETGMGEPGADGTYGLQRAFRMAGVRYMLVTLWKIPDRESSEFILCFYRSIASGSSIRQAFLDSYHEMMRLYPESADVWCSFRLIE